MRIAATSPLQCYDGFNVTCESSFWPVIDTRTSKFYQGEEKKALEIITELKCFNKAITPENDIYYIVGKGEVRWECKLLDQDTEELKKYGLQLENTFVRCPSLADGECMAGYKLHLSPAIYLAENDSSVSAEKDGQTEVRKRQRAVDRAQVASA